MFQDVLELKPRRLDGDRLDVSGGGTANLWAEGC